jgi:hypothetical protein
MPPTPNFSRQPIPINTAGYRTFSFQCSPQFRYPSRHSRKTPTLSAIPACISDRFIAFTQNPVPSTPYYSSRCGCSPHPPPQPYPLRKPAETSAKNHPFSPLFRGSFSPFHFVLCTLYFVLFSLITHHFSSKTKHPSRLHKMGVESFLLSFS